MTLRYQSRAALETCRPAVISEDDDAVLVQCLDSFAVWAMKSDVSVTPSLRNVGYWETWITSWFTHHIEDGDFVVDIGANCGYYTMLFEKLVGPEGRVVAYEASKRYAALLSRTKDYNDANFVIENVAVADKPGELTLTYPGYYTGSASVTGTPFDKRWGEEHHETVEATTLDNDFDGLDTPSLVKIDAESAEEMIWNGAKELFNRNDAPVIVLEYSPTDTYSKDFDAALFDYGSVRRINFAGIEEPIGPSHLKRLRDWEMIVIRKKP